jgi:LPXTG-site transpeptidase (sortase) family protein
MYISIPEIDAQAPVTINVDPFNSVLYHAVLTHSVAQAQGTSLPGQKGTVYLFAHSSGPPWQQTHFNTIFVRLSELKKGDKVYLVRNGVIYMYKVRSSKVVFPNAVSYLQNTKRNQLILQTCTPIGTDYQRLLVFADPITS